jgi:hypothetical protein
MQGSILHYLPHDRRLPNSAIPRSGAFGRVGLAELWLKTTTLGF